jgi:hypothetical protein
MEEAKMKDDGVHTAFGLILEEIGSLSKELKQEAKRLVDKNEFDTVSTMMDTGKRLDNFQVKVRSLQTEWIKTFDPTTRSRTHFEPPIDVLPSEALSLVMTYGEATADAEYKNGNVNLLAGSTIRKEIHESLPDHIRDKRKETLSNGQIIPVENSDLYRVKAPIIFGSPSGAAQFVAGCSVSGPREWHVKGKGLSLKLWLGKKR